MLIIHEDTELTDFIDTVQPGDVVYFTASWCGPCKRLKPQYARAATLDVDRDYHLIDIEANDEGFVEYYKIMTIPRVLYVNDRPDESGNIDTTVYTELKARTAETLLEEIGLTEKK
jgi:thiol-disulfide isomerase/thioredoxin